MSSSEKVILRDNFKFYRALKPFYRKSFEKKALKFIKKYDFVGAENFEITQEVKLMIAASFVQLTFGMRMYKFDRFKAIIVFPEAFYSPQNNAYHIGEYNRMRKLVVFSWKDFVSGIKIENDNINLGLHEFGHALLAQTKIYTGGDQDYFTLQRYYEKIQKKIKDKAYIEKVYQTQFFREYAFVNEMEFFSVILEYFYENPMLFQQKVPDLFDDLKNMLSYNKIWFQK